MSFRCLIAAVLVGVHFHSLAIFAAGALVAFAIGGLRIEMRGRITATEERTKNEIRRNR